MYPLLYRIKTLILYFRLKIANHNILPKYVSVWSSGLTNTKCLSKNQFAVQVWGGSTWQENYDLIDNGFNLIFSHVDAWYLDCGFGSWRPTGKSITSMCLQRQHEELIYYLIINYYLLFLNKLF